MNKVTYIVYDVIFITFVLSVILNLLLHSGYRNIEKCEVEASKAGMNFTYDSFSGCNLTDAGEAHE